MFFYSFAINNGALGVLANTIVYAVRKIPWLIPIMIYVTSMILSGIGPGSVSMFMVLIPLFMQIAVKINMKMIFCMICIVTGVNCAAWSPIAVQGIQTISLIQMAGYTAEEAQAFGMVVFRNRLIYDTVYFVVAYFIFRGFKCKAEGIEKPQKFDEKQKKSLVLIGILLVLVVIPAFLKAVTGASWIAWFADRIDISYLAVVFAFVSIVMKLGDEKKAFASVPWPTIFLVCGMGILVEVASKAGAIALLSEAISENLSMNAIPYITALIASGFSAFASTTGVVMPTLFPIVKGICDATGTLPTLLFSVIPIAATGMSPLSLAGGIGMANAPEEKRGRLFYHMLAVQIFAAFGVMIGVVIGLIRV
jgi:di/tricarboxylate transporter